MSENNNKATKPKIKKDRAISPLWLFTLIAFGLSGWMLYKTVNEAGQRIQIYFSNAQGIEAGRTTIRFNGLEVGIVRRINLSEDLGSIFVDADIYPEAIRLLGEDTAFWLVKPKASLAGISGLDALVSGNYIAIKPGTVETENLTYTAAEEPPADGLTQTGLHIKLTSNDLGSLSEGSLLFYKKIPVGEVYDYRLTPDNQQVVLSVLIEPEYAGLVNENTRFWNVSGFKANIGVNGVDVDFHNVGALLAGGIAFDSPESDNAANDFDKYPLYSDINQAERGLKINISLPEGHGITNEQSPILFKGLEIGRLSDISLSPDKKGLVATASIDPAMDWLLSDKTRFIIEKTELDFGGLKNASNLIFGDFITVHPEKGQSSRDFTAHTRKQLKIEDPDAAKISVTAKNAWGIDENTKVLHRGVQVGFVSNVELFDDSVNLSLLIDKKYKHLIKSRSRFFMVGGITGAANEDGIEVIVPAVSQIADPAISFTSEGSKKIADKYTLYKTEISARHARNEEKGFQRYTIYADSLPSLSVGSPVMHKNFTVGKVTDVRLGKGQAQITVGIENAYRHLITVDTVFWNHSGLSLEASISNGLTVNTGSLKSLVSGGIAFDNIKGVENRIGKQWKLYPSLKAAEHFGFEVTFTAATAKGLSKGSKIRYQGIDVGEVTTLLPEFSKKGVNIKARLYPTYAQTFARENSYFWLVSPEVSLSGAKNLDALITPYVAVEPGNGSRSKRFELNNQEKQKSGLVIYLESEDRSSISVGTPLLFRDMEIGHVLNIELGRFSDRIIIKAKINDKYRHLIRENTIFWNSSGLDVSIGLTGAEIKTGTVGSIIKGGIALAIPEETPLKKVASNGRHFLLYKQANPTWKKWRTAIPGF